MGFEVIAKLVAEVAKEAGKDTAKEIAKQNGKGVIDSSKNLDVRKPVEYTGTKGEKFKPIDGLTNKVNLDKRIPQDVSKIKNNVFEINGYKYTTDNLGRTVSAEGKLRLEPDTGRNKLQQKEAGGKDRLKTDDGGHLFARRFGGIGEKNLVAQDGVLNKGPYNRLEDKWANAIKNGDQVYAKIEPKYSGNSMRPDSFRVNYSINGEKFKTTFSNIPNFYAK